MTTFPLWLINPYCLFSLILNRRVCCLGIPAFPPRSPARTHVENITTMVRALKRHFIVSLLVKGQTIIFVDHVTNVHQMAVCAKASYSRLPSGSTRTRKGYHRWIENRPTFGSVSVSKTPSYRIRHTSDRNSRVGVAIDTDDNRTSLRSNGPNRLRQREAAPTMAAFIRLIAWSFPWPGDMSCRMLHCIVPDILGHVNKMQQALTPRSSTTGAVVVTRWPEDTPSRR